jgi:methyltransferase (TIGR00027 family)
MQQGTPSRTAFATARARARHQLTQPLVFDDPLAIPLLGLDRAELTEALDEQARRTQFFVALRSRYAEDIVAEAAAAGVRQVVVLGAGLDTFGCRNPHPGLRVFEVDHPDTQAWKRERLAAAGIAIPESLTFAHTDFEEGGIEHALADAGFDRSAPALFLWLGVMQYLTADAIRGTLRLVAGGPPPAGIVFDYSEPASAMTPDDRASWEQRAARVAALGEPWRSFYLADELAALLRESSFDEIVDLRADELAARYTGRAADPARHVYAHMVHATRTR